ncbi:MAG: serine hydrolase domain-containing protein [Verrucomicrobiia bacterium]
MHSTKLLLNLLWAAACLGPATARGGETAAPLLTADLHNAHPRVTWTNVTGETYQLLTCEQITNDEWSSWITLSAEGTKATWTDETGARPALFYRVLATAETNWAARLQTALVRARKSAGAKGVSAVVITTNGIWQGTSGVSTSKPTNGIEPQMRFSIGSISKTFITALIMQLAEEGKVSLDDPLSRWLPDYRNITNVITIRQLLSHTSGVFNLTESPNYWPMVTRTNKVYAHDEALGLVGARNFLPGKGYRYSNTGFILLGLVAEAASQDSAAHQIRSRFLEPLHLAGIYLEGAEEASGDRAHGFTASYTGSLQDVTTNSIWRVEYPVAWTAGAMTSTAYDLALWIRALYGGHVLSDNSLGEMTKWTSLSGSTYGLGTMRISSSKGEFWGHNGGITGYLSVAGHSPTRHTTVVVLVNQDTVDVGAIWGALVNTL